MVRWSAGRVLGAVMRFAGTRPPDAAIRRGLAYGLDGPTTGRVIADFVPESPGLYRDKTGRRPWSGQRGYVFTERDRGLPIAAQRGSARRLGQDWTGHLGTGHLPMAENPSALAGAIDEFLRSPARTDTSGRPGP